MTDSNTGILLELTKNALANTDSPLSKGNADWSVLANVAFKQGISAIVLDAIELLPSAQRPPKPQLMQWIGRTAVMERMYVQHKEAIAQLATYYKQHDIQVLLLKGYGCSLCYPHPEHRPTGDMDIYLFGRQEEADSWVEKELGIKVHREYHKHSTFRFQGTEVENHAKFIDDVSHKSNILFEKTLMDLLKKEKCIDSPIDNVLLPPPTFNALFLLRHTGEHFASNEITLRQVLDVGTFFQRYHDELDWSFVFQVYKEQRMTQFFNAIATICVDYLGIDASSFASADLKISYQRDTKLANRIWKDIFEEKKQLPMSTYGIDTLGKQLHYAISKTHRWWQNRWKYRLVYNENLLQSFWWLARNRIES